MFRTPCSIFAVLALAGVCGCERVVGVGGLSDGGVDAGVDASSDAASDAYMPDPIFGPAATREQFEQFARDISGRWYGIVTRQNQEEAVRVELDFVPNEKLTEGAFYVVCTQSDRCDPFGFRNLDEGHYLLKHLEADGPNVGAAMGVLAWAERGDEARISFQKMLLQRAGEVLSFRFSLAFPLPPEERTAILVRTMPSPIDDGGPGSRDGGPL
jgi:hypothetical protein